MVTHLSNVQSLHTLLNLRAQMGTVVAYMAGRPRGNGNKSCHTFSDGLSGLPKQMHRELSFFRNRDHRQVSDHLFYVLQETASKWSDARADTIADWLPIFVCSQKRC